MDFIFSSGISYKLIFIDDTDLFLSHQSIYELENILNKWRTWSKLN